jgi:E3 ubiquitin-protein ligase RNF38/44
MIPVFCFCMPCLIRVLARLHDPQAQQQGATDDLIATLPLVVISRDHLRQNGDENACAICLNEMTVGEEARILQCKHLFHKLVRQISSLCWYLRLSFVSEFLPTKFCCCFTH